LEAIAKEGEISNETDEKLKSVVVNFLALF